MFEEFVRRIKGLYDPQLFILFGSRARGTALTDSDYDLIIVSRLFEGIPYTDRMTPIYKLWNLKEGLECICLTPGEFERAKDKISIVREALKEGVLL